MSLELQLCYKLYSCWVRQFLINFKTQHKAAYGAKYIATLCLRDYQLFSVFHKSTESTLGGGGKSSCTLSKMLVLAAVPVHETSLANQH